MTDGADRRLTILRHRSGLDGRSDEWLEDCVENATAAFLEYTNRQTDPGEKADRVICDLAAHFAYYEGVDTVASASDGSMSRSFYDGIPPIIRQRMQSWRLVPGLYDAADEPRRAPDVYLDPRP